MRVESRPENKYPFWIRAILAAQRKRYGMSLEPIKLWGRSPKLLFGLQALYSAIDRKGSPLDPALRSLVSVRVSQINHCSFCVDINSDLLRKRGVSVDKVLALPEYESNAVFSDKERAALSYAEAMTRYDRGVDDAVFRALQKYFSDDEIIELTAVIAYQNLSSKFNAALDIPSHGFCSIPKSR